VKRIPVATELGRHDRFWPAVMASVAVHAAAIGFAVKASSLPTIELDQKPIQARLVRLGEKKPEHLLPQKETPPAPAPAPPPAAPPPPPVVQPPPPPAAPPAPAAMPAPTPAKPATRPAPPARPTPNRSPANGAGIGDVLARMEKQVQRERWGDPNGDPEGDSDEGSAGDRYEALITKAVHANYQVPSTIPDKERISLKANVKIWVGPDGTIRRFEITKSSGNPAFDDALERAIRATRLPPPPDEWEQQFRESGRILQFEI
jgi:colicin import membrane protein